VNKTLNSRTSFTVKRRIAGKIKSIYNFRLHDTFKFITSPQSHLLKRNSEKEAVSPVNINPIFIKSSSTSKSKFIVM
jgi:hypothetical protein